MNVIEFITKADPDSNLADTDGVVTEELVESAFRTLCQVGKILTAYTEKYEIDESTNFNDLCVRSDPVMIEGSQEVFPEIMELLLREIN